MRLERWRDAVSQERSTWLAALGLLLGILAPAAAVVWFMNEAVANQADAARQRVSDAYRGQVRLLRDRIDADWKARAAALEGERGTDAVAFRRVVLSGQADSIVFLRADGAPAYPSQSVARRGDAFDDRADWRTAQTLEDAGHHALAARAYAQIAGRERDTSRAARSAQAHVRALAKAGDINAAITAIDRHFASGRLASGRDSLGRLIAADAHLLALRLIPPADTRRARLVERLESIVNDYERVTMPSPQRLFLMGELLDLAPSARVPTYGAERLAADFLQDGGAPATGSSLQATTFHDIWKLRVGGAAIALFKTTTVVAAAQRVFERDVTESGATFALVPPGMAAPGDPVAAGPVLPGWQIGFSLVDAGSIEAGARQRASTYLWAGTLAIAALAVAGVLLWQSFRRQMRLTRLKTDLVAAVSHELKTPLASMRLLVDSLLDDAELDRRKTRDYLQLMAGENARLTRLIEHFLTFARIERNRQRFTFARVQPAEVVGSAVGLVRQRFAATGTDLTVNVEPQLPALYGDEDALVTVLLNLLENAHTYTRDDKRIAVRARKDASHILFEVTDNGIGIAPREQKRVFRRFYQVDRSLSREHGGCGLGLSIVDFIVRAHGGRVALQSEVGVGSRFSVSIPVRQAEQGAAA